MFSAPDLKKELLQFGQNCANSKKTGRDHESDKEKVMKIFQKKSFPGKYFSSVWNIPSVVPKNYQHQNRQELANCKNKVNSFFLKLFFSQRNFSSPGHIPSTQLRKRQHQAE